MPFDIITNEADWNFPIEKQPIYDQHGLEIPGQCCIMRTDTNTVMGVHGSRYTPITHADTVQIIEDAARSAKLSEDMQLKVITADGGRRLRVEALFPSINIEPKLNDISSFRSSGFNSYDGSWSFGTLAQAMRLICTNGMEIPDKGARYRMKHTTNINIEGISANMNRAVEAFFKQEDRWKHMIERSVTASEVKAFLDNFSALGPRRINERKWNAVHACWTRERSALGHNQYALFNALTYWSTHTDGRQPEITRRNRENEVLHALADPIFA